MKKLLSLFFCVAIVLSFGCSNIFAAESTPVYTSFPLVSSEELPAEFRVIEHLSKEDFSAYALVEDLPVYYEEFVDVYGVTSTSNYRYRRFTYANSYTVTKTYSLISQHANGKLYAVNLSYSFY